MKIQLGNCYGKQLIKNEHFWFETKRNFEIENRKFYCQKIRGQKSINQLTKNQRREKVRKEIKETNEVAKEAEKRCS